MKSLKSLSFLLVGIIGIQTAFAADLAFGVRAGLNLGKLEFSESSSYEGESFNNGTSQGKYSSSETSDASYLYGNLIGFQIGAVLDVKITDFLYVQPGIMLSSKGTESESESEETSASYNSKSKHNLMVNPYYIEVPVMLSLKGSLAENLALRAQIGPYIGFGLFGGAEISEKYESYSNGIPNPDNADPENGAKRKIKNVFSPTDEEIEKFEGFGGLNRFNFGIGFGVGIEYNNFYLGANYSMGLTNIAKKVELSESDEPMPGYTTLRKVSYEPEIYERTFSITLGYNF